MKRYILFVLLMLLMFSSKAYAANYAPNECLNNDTCLLLCNYENNFSGVMRSMSIYYYFDGKWEVDYWNHIENSYYGTKGPDSFGKVFSTSFDKSIYWLTGVGSSNFTCPEHGYFDRQALTEMCFADTQEECEKKSGWTFTLFGSRDSDFKSDKKDYDFEDEILNYQEHIIKDIAEDITSGKLSASDIPNQVKKDFQTNFLHGNEVPAFMENTEAYQTIADAAKKEYEKYKKEELEKAKEALEAARQRAKEAEDRYGKGEITNTELNEAQKEQTKAETEYETVQTNWSATGEEVASGVEEVLQQITITGSGALISDWDGKTCTSLLGSKSDKSAPYYYLNFAFSLIKYIAIVLLFVLSIVEYFKAIASSDGDALKKASQMTLKRLIICLIILLLPILIDFVFRLLGVASDPTCGIGG